MFSSGTHKNSYKPLAKDATRMSEEGSWDAMHDGRRNPDLEQQIPQIPSRDYKDASGNTSPRIQDSNRHTDVILNNHSASSDAYSRKLLLVQDNAFKFQDFVPYQLSEENTSLFPEFYFHFKRYFAGLSSLNGAYVTLDPSQFRSLHEGTEHDIQRAVENVENEYDATFRKCLTPELQAKFVNWKFTRASVEADFKQQMAAMADVVAYPRRLDTLLSSARSGEIRPLLDFFEAFQFSENDAWHYMLLAFGRSFTSTQRSQFLNSRIEVWQQASGPLSERVDGFVQDLRREGMNDAAAKLVVAVFAVGIFVFLMAVTRGFSRFHGHKHH